MSKQVPTSPRVERGPMVGNHKTIRVQDQLGNKEQAITADTSLIPGKVRRMELPAVTFTHPLPSAKGVDCHMCAAVLTKSYPASHKVEEVTDDARHPFTAYVCCRHFAMIMGTVAARYCAAAVQS